MHSDATGTAAIGAVGTGINGDITFERFVPDNTNDAASFVNLSSYVSGINATNWSGSGAAWIFEYDETNTGGSMMVGRKRREYCRIPEKATWQNFPGMQA